MSVDKRPCCKCADLLNLRPEELSLVISSFLFEPIFSHLRILSLIVIARFHSECGAWVSAAGFGASARLPLAYLISREIFTNYRRVPPFERDKLTGKRNQVRTKESMQIICVKHFSEERAELHLHAVTQRDQVLTNLARRFPYGRGVILWHNNYYMIMTPLVREWN